MKFILTSRKLIRSMHQVAANEAELDDILTTAQLQAIKVIIETPFTKSWILQRKGDQKWTTNMDVRKHGRPFVDRGHGEGVECQKAEARKPLRILAFTKA